jgi:predicted metal-binding protein
MAKGNGPFIYDCSIKISIYGESSIAMFDYQRVSQISCDRSQGTSRFPSQLLDVKLEATTTAVAMATCKALSQMGLP